MADKVHGETSCRRLWLSSHVDRALHRDRSVSGTCSPGTVLVDHGRANIWGCVTGMCLLVFPGVPMGSRQGPPVICVSPGHVPPLLKHVFIANDSDFCFHQLSRWCSRACEKKPPVRETPCQDGRGAFVPSLACAGGLGSYLVQ